MGACEICGMPGMTVEVNILDPWGRHHRVTIHIACEDDRMAKMRFAGARGMN